MFVESRRSERSSDSLGLQAPSRSYISKSSSMTRPLPLSLRLLSRTVLNPNRRRASQIVKLRCVQSLKLWRESHYPAIWGRQWNQIRIGEDPVGECIDWKVPNLPGKHPTTRDYANHRSYSECMLVLISRSCFQ